jgi:sphingolipid 4-desaturase/C4-monooxygenase
MSTHIEPIERASNAEARRGPSGAPGAFLFSGPPEPHRRRTAAMLTAHPEMRALIGRNPFSALAAVACVAAELALAWWARDQAWWALALVAFCVGAFLSHLLFVLVHEAAHNLIFRSRTANYLLGIFANSVQIVPSAVHFMRFHIKHHAFQGVFELDMDLPSRFECDTFKRWWGKALWLALFPVWQIFRTSRAREVKWLHPWVLFNWLVVFSVDAAIFYFWGIKALAFVTLSLVFSLGLHPLGGRWIQEHFLKDGSPQETYSYYGPLNAVQMNIGYHFEHHDFPSVPWSRLPKVRAMALEFYTPLRSHRSWTLLVLKFIFDPTMTVASRLSREDRGSVALDDPSSPDRDIVAAAVV